MFPVRQITTLKSSKPVLILNMPWKSTALPDYGWWLHGYHEMETVFLYPDDAYCCVCFSAIVDAILQSNKGKKKSH